MTRMVQLAVAGDINEAEEIQEILTSAGIPSELQSALDEPLTVDRPGGVARRREGGDRGAHRARRNHRRAVAPRGMERVVILGAGRGGEDRRSADELSRRTGLPVVYLDVGVLEAELDARVACRGRA